MMTSIDDENNDTATATDDDEVIGQVSDMNALCCLIFYSDNCGSIFARRTHCAFH